MLKAIAKIKESLHLLDIYYPPCKFNDIMEISGPMGFIGAKTGIDPLPDSFCLEIKLNYKITQDEGILDIIEELLLSDTQDEPYSVVNRGGDGEKFMYLYNEYLELEETLNELLPITIEDCHQYNTIHKINRIKTIVKQIHDISNNIGYYVPSIILYCRVGMPMYNIIRDDLYDYIKR